jgi:hypothetical protein
LSTVVDEDELRDVAQRREVGPERVVVEARPAVQHDHRRTLAQGRPVGDEPLAQDLEVHADVADASAHRVTLDRS